jgi:hypothetical protein
MENPKKRVTELCLSWDSSCTPINNMADENTIRARLENFLPSQSKGTMRLSYAVTEDGEIIDREYDYQLWFKSWPRHSGYSVDND